MEQADYAFSDRGEEQRRLQHQSELFDPLTERVFRAAGLEAGMRVLDIGSGAGDVAMLAARLVGPEGAVVGVERDPDAVKTAVRVRCGSGCCFAAQAAKRDVLGIS